MTQVSTQEAVKKQEGVNFPERTMRILLHADRAGNWPAEVKIFQLSKDRKGNICFDENGNPIYTSNEYRFSIADSTDSGIVIDVRKVTGKEEFYTLYLENGQDASCTCWDHRKLGHERPCKHVAAARKLIDKGAL